MPSMEPNVWKKFNQLREELSQLRVRTNVPESVVLDVFEKIGNAIGALADDHQLLVTTEIAKLLESRDPRINQAFKGLWAHSVAVGILGPRFSWP